MGQSEITLCNSRSSTAVAAAAHPRYPPPPSLSLKPLGERRKEEWEGMVFTCTAITGTGNAVVVIVVIVVTVVVDSCGSVGRLNWDIIIASMGGDRGNALTTLLPLLLLALASVLASTKDPVTDCRLLYTHPRPYAHRLVYP